MIRVLSDDVRCRLRSGVAITSVAQCVEELVLNSADARATCIAVRIDLETFKVQVVDNGCGLCREDMDRVGTRFCTSKCHSVQDLEDLRFFGFRGEALASMVDVSGVVEICSRHKDTAQTFSRTFRNGNSLALVEVETTRPSAGTTVTLYNLFSSLPVRRKHLEQALELERIQQRLEAIALMKPDISFSLRNNAVHSVVLHLPKTKELSSRFCQIYGPGRSQGLREVQHTHSGLTIHGLVSCEGHYNKTMQFLYVNKRLVLKTKLHKLLDFIIRGESTICRGRSGRPCSASDLYGVFVINIQCHVSEYDVCFQPDKTLIEFRDWDRVMLCAEQGLRNFLKRENLFLEVSKDEVAEFSQKHHYNLSCEGGKQPVAPHDTRTVGTSSIAYLRSRCVRRSRDITAPSLGALHRSPPSLLGSHHGSSPPLFEVYHESPSPPCVAHQESGLSPLGAHHGSPLPHLGTHQESPPLPFVTQQESPPLPFVTQQESPPLPLVAHQESPPPSLGAHQESPPPPLVAHQESDHIPENTLEISQDGSPLTSPDTSTIQGAAGVSPCPAQNPTNPRSLRCEHVRAGISKWIPPRCGPPPAYIKVSTPTGLRGSLDKFRRLYGKSGCVGRQYCEPQQPRKAGADAFTNVQEGSAVPNLSHPKQSHDPECTPTLTSKLCMLKNNEEAAQGGGGIQTPGSSPTSTACKDSDGQSQQDGRMSESPPDSPMSKEWLQCYEESLGKNIFINTATGLSSYSAPTREQTAACIQDLSSMLVVCKSGFQSQCHPYKTPALSPFLPRPRAERDPGGPRDIGDLSSLYTEWKNPVYVRQPSLAVDVSRGHSDYLSVKIHNILYPYRFTKEMVHSIKVLQQVDSKFIACLMNAETEQSVASGGHLLVLVDQHAAHERVRLEQLIADSFEVSESGERHLKVSVVEPPLAIHVSSEAYRVLRTRAGTLRRLGLSVSFPDPGSPCILVTKIPLCFVEREVNETQRGRTPVVQRLVELLQVLGAGHGAVPGVVLRVLASQACHGAVKFNHPLTMDECCHLMYSLAQCSLPFQCAHGRPSILPLADLQHIAPEPEVTPTPNLKRLGRQQRAWQRYKERMSAGAETVLVHEEGL
ncbi:DNA mismatch repair protein Mlh3 isoform X2 [Dendropsophus ebraccatus]|uniref:DNA mismatch repair protein Mlh3 isoform X2 n=1 Tax=Dendropsophus ebraccatus TaxID=150705 RepID=UPI00383176BA